MEIISWGNECCYLSLTSNIPKIRNLATPLILDQINLQSEPDCMQKSEEDKPNLQIRLTNRDVIPGPTSMMIQEHVLLR